MIWPNRGGGFGISEIVDVVSLDTDEARLYHEPEVVDNNIFFPMNWTFHLSCDRIRSNDCIFNPIRRAPSRWASFYVGLAKLPTRDAGWTQYLIMTVIARIEFCTHQSLALLAHSLYNVNCEHRWW